MERTAYKACPTCGQAWVITAESCTRCGHQFQTRFLPPTSERTQMIYPQSPAPPPQVIYYTPAPPMEMPRQPQEVVGLVVACIICTLISLFAFPIIFGPLAIGIAVMIISRRRPEIGIPLLIASIFCMFFGMLVGFFIGLASFRGG